MNPFPRSALPLPSQMRGKLSTSKRGSTEGPLDALTPPTYTYIARLLVHAYTGRRIHFTFEKLKKKYICLAV